MSVLTCLGTRRKAKQCKREASYTASAFSRSHHGKTTPLVTFWVTKKVQNGRQKKEDFSFHIGAIKIPDLAPRQTGSGSETQASKQS